MKNKLFKNIVSIVLVSALALTGAFATVTPAEAKSSVPEIKKATYIIPDTTLYDYKKETYGLKVEAGNKFYMGDLVTAGVKYSNGEEWNRYLTGLDATYKSSNASVCAVDKSTGVVTPKKTGSAKITINYKKQKSVITVKVVKKGALKHNKKIDKLEAKLKKNTKAFKGIFDEKNAKKMIAAAKKCKTLVEPYYYRDYDAVRYGAEMGFGAKEADDGFYSTTNELIYPWCAHYYAMNQIISGDFYIKYDPFHRTSVNPVYFKSAKAQAGTSDVTVTLNRKITDLEYYILSYCGQVIESGKPAAQCYITSDADPGYFMIISGPIKKNSDKITMTMSYAYDKAFNLYWADDTTATAATIEKAKKLTTFQSKGTYNFYTGYTIDEAGNESYEKKSASWTDNLKFTVE